MEKGVLSSYLDAGLFRIGDDDSRLQLFEKAAEDLAEGFRKSPSAVIPAILVGVDPAAPERDPMLEKAELAVKTHWSTFSNKYDQRPVGLLRPVLLEALSRAADGNPVIASAIWLSGMNLACRIDLRKEKPIIDMMLRGLGEATEAFATRDSGRFDFKPPELSIKSKPSKKTKVDRKGLEQGLGGAAGPQNREGQAYPKPNPHWTNSAGAWSYEFAPRAAEAISTAIDNVTALLADQTAEFATEIEKKLNDLATGLNTALHSLDEAAVGYTGLRASLLWIKESLYSPSLRRSYREMNPAEVAVAMALDLAALCRPPAPQSVEYLLREMFVAAVPTDPKMSIAELLLRSKESTLLEAILPKVRVPSGPTRGCLYTALLLARETELAKKDFPFWIGVPGELSLSARSLSVWIFRDAQAIQAVGGIEK